MSGIKRKKTNYAVIVGLLILANLALLNILAGRYFGRLDLTQTKMYSLSSNTRKVLSSLNDIITIDVYFSENVPENLKQPRQWMYDLLDEYVNFGRGNIVVKRHDIKKEGLEEQLLNIGIEPEQFQQVEKDKVEFAVYFMGIAINSGDRTEKISKIKDINRFEYDLTAKIYKVMHPERTIGLVVPAYPDTIFYKDSFNQFSALRDRLSQLYQVRNVNLDSDPIPPEISTLIVFTAYPYVDFKQDSIQIPAGEGNSPQTIPVLEVITSKFSEDALKKLDEFLASGGNMALLLDPVQRYDCQQLMRAGVPSCDPIFKVFPVKSGLEDMLKSWGILIGPELVMDRNGEEIPIGNASFEVDTRTGRVIPRQKIIKYAFWPRIQKENISGENPLTQGIDQLILTWATPVRVDEANKGGRTIATLFSSSKEYEIKPLGDPQKRFFPDMRTGRVDLPQGESVEFNPDATPIYAKKSSVPLAVLVEGVFPRFYKTETSESKPAESQSGPASEPGNPNSGQATPDQALFISMPSTPEQKPPAAAPPEAPGKLLVIGSADIFSDDFNTDPKNPDRSRNAPVMVLLTNAVDYMELGKDLLSLRARKTLVPDRPWKDLSEGLVTFLKFFLIIGLSIIVAVVGVVRWTFRNREKYRYESSCRGESAPVDTGAARHDGKGGGNK